MTYISNLVNSWCRNLSYLLQLAWMWDKIVISHYLSEYYLTDGISTHEDYPLSPEIISNSGQPSHDLLHLWISEINHLHSLSSQIFTFTSEIMQFSLEVFTHFSLFITSERHTIWPQIIFKMEARPQAASFQPPGILLGMPSSLILVPWTFQVFGPFRGSEPNLRWHYERGPSAL